MAMLTHVEKIVFSDHTSYSFLSLPSLISVLITLTEEYFDFFFYLKILKFKKALHMLLWFKI